MSQLDSISPEAIVTACRNNAPQAAESLASCFGGQWSLQVPDAASSSEGAAPAAEAGLVFVLKLAQGAAALFWPESAGLLPDWIQNTDATSRSKLSTLAQELGLLLLPDDLAAADFAAGYVTDLAEVWQRGAFAPEGGALPLTLTSAQRSGVATLAWLATEPNMLQAEPTAPPAPSAPPPPIPTSVGLTPHAAPSLNFEESLAELPPYMRSLLRIKVQLTVSLATTRQPVRRIVELGPGSIIQFDKRCDEPLDLCVDGQEIAVGEAVKVGEKFGMRLSSMVLPKERFLPLRK
jgi:flagellar motor switch protein FliN